MRWNWDSPLAISPHSHKRVYFAANKLFRSDDRGDSWKAVSGDLTRQIDRNTLPVMGKIWGPDAVAKNVSTSFYGNIVALSESPKKEGLIYAGTDDGNIARTFLFLTPLPPLGFSNRSWQPSSWQPSNQIR